LRRESFGACDRRADYLCAGKARGFSLSRQSGSHKIYKHPISGKRVTVPCHAGKILHPKVLKNILADAGMTADDLEKLLK
jgi:predicted RNA binding protein YcfA (HicA-like mRNA interferase family)